MKTKNDRSLEWLPAMLAAVAFVGCFAAFVWQLFVYQKDVLVWSEADLKSRAELAASTLAEPLRTLDFKAIQKVADQLKSDGLRLRITQGHFFVSESDNTGWQGFFDTCGEPYPADVPCMFKVARTGDFFVGIGRPAGKMLLPFLGSLFVIVLATLVGISGVLLFFFVTYRQRVRIRELAKLEKFRREFIADVSHEIKTPLTGILGAVDMLDGLEAKEEAEGERRKVLLSLIRKESKRLNGLVQSILDLARLERKGETLNRTETDVGELVREVVETFRPQAKSAGVSLVFAAPSRPLCAQVDSQAMAQAVANLVANALRHSGSADVAVSVQPEGRRLRVVVEDHGVGIPPEHASRIFERFHRVDPARSAETGGAGLGLAIARRIARLHGGDVTLAPASPRGSRFEISFVFALVCSLLTFAVSAAVGSCDAEEVRLGVISDTHVTGPESAAELEKALAFLRERRVDAVLHCGDITDFGYLDELRAFADVWRRTMPAGVRLVAALGNRDLSDTNKLSAERRQADHDLLICARPDKALEEVLGIAGGTGVRVTTVKGVNVIAADWKHEDELEDFLMAHPEVRPTGRPFVCIQHPHPTGTVFGWGARDAKDVSTCILKMFPQAWSFSGHSHEPFARGGSLWRGEFTAAAAGCYFLGSGFGGFGREVSVLTLGCRRARLDRYDLRSGAVASSSWEEGTKPSVPDGCGVFVQWNVGHFCRGRGSEPTLSHVESAAVAADWRRVLEQTGAELLGVCEYSPAVDTAGTPARQAVFGGFAHFDSGSQRGYQCNALAGKNSLGNVRSGEYARQVQKTYWLAAETEFAGVKTTVVETHLDFADEEVRRAQIEELVRLFGKCPHVIVSGDFNVAETYEYAAFARAGFQLANWGRFGSLPTHRRRKVGLTPAIDNVMTRGFDIADVSVVDEPLKFSDHRALRCVLRPR